MPRRLVVLNVLLGMVSLVFAVGIVRTLLVKHPLPSAGAPRPIPAPPPPAATATADPGPETYAVIAAQNLFNPGRSETATAAVAVVKPILHGVVIQGTTSRAFLEDPTVKRVGGYSVGDTIGGGKIQTIADDRVVISRPEGMVEVLLQDPSKPRPAPSVTGPAVTAGQGQPAPGQPPAAGQIVPGQFAPGQPAPGQFVPVQVPPGQPAPGQPLPAQVSRPAPDAPPSLPSQNRRRPTLPGQPPSQ